jgi:hypothetical protein
MERITVSKTYKGTKYTVSEVGNGVFRVQPEVNGNALWRSLTALAEAITGKHLSGRAFFGLWNGAPRVTLTAVVKRLREAGLGEAADAVEAATADLVQEAALEAAEK